MSTHPAAPPTLPLVPAPVSAHPRAGAPFRLAGARVVTTTPDADAAAHRLADRLNALVGLRPDVVREPGREPAPGAVVLTVEPGAGDPGGYRLEVASDRVALTAPDAAGLQHGVATLLQLVDPAARTVRPALVADAPRFAWRGLSLDVVRHFHAVATVRALIDVMADLRLNVLHLHLTDDQGWRLDLPGHPELAARSAGTAVDGDPGGCYSVDDYADLQEYAASRGVLVVPEIDLPGHVNAALHAIPELNPDGVATDVYTGIEVGFSRLHADLPATEPFVRGVLTEVAALTRGPYVHVGGDEPPEMPAEEYAALVGLAVDAVRAAGRTPIGWQEVARAPLPPGAVVQYWDDRAEADAAAVARAAAAGARVLLSPASRAYLDMKYDADTPVGFDWAGHISLRHAYDWEPLDVLPGAGAEAVLGVEAALWSETIRTPDDLFLLLLPRLAAFAEVAWSRPDVRGWDGFTTRVAHLGPRWEAAGLRWHPVPDVAW